MAGSFCASCLSLRHLKMANAQSIVRRFRDAHRPVTSFTKESKLITLQFHSFSQSAVSATYNDKPYIPRRTLMYVPGHDPKKLMKIPHLNVDCAVLECEDGVAVNMKAQARKNIKEALTSLHVDGVDIALRINSVSSNLMESDLSAIIGKDLGEPLDLRYLPHTVLLPKVDTVEELDLFTNRFNSAKHDRKYAPFLVTYVESAQGLINLNKVLRRASEHSRDGHFKIDAVVFGSDDFCADIGAERTADAKELMYARQKVVTVAKAYRLQAIDMVHVDIHDKDGLKTMSEAGARMGFTGKQIIHPGQVSIVKEAFTPSEARLEWATQLVKAFNEHQTQGKGAFTFRGQMIDMPLLRQAKNVLSIVKKVHKS